MPRSTLDKVALMMSSLQSFRSYAEKKNKGELELMQARQKARELRNAPLHQADEGDGSEALPKQPKDRKSVV